MIKTMIVEPMNKKQEVPERLTTQKYQKMVDEVIMNIDRKLQKRDRKDIVDIRPRELPYISPQVIDEAITRLSERSEIFLIEKITKIKRGRNGKFITTYNNSFIRIIRMRKKK